MFCLTGATRFKYIPGYRDMRGGYEKLSSVIRSLGEEIEEGTANVFTSKDQKLVKIIRHENCERQLYVQRFDSIVRIERLIKGLHHSHDHASPVHDAAGSFISAGRVD